jgi:hypothetical protein
MTREEIQEIFETKRKLLTYLKLMGATIDGNELIVYDGTIEELSRMLELLTKNQ